MKQSAQDDIQTPTPAGQAPDAAQTTFTDAREAARACLAHPDGPFQPIPIPAGTKGPRTSGWQKLRLAEDDVDAHFPPDANIGLLLGTASNGLVDVDLDCPEARQIAPDFLPATRMVHGRKSAPVSHYWYLVEGEHRIAKFTDATGAMLVELRSGTQDAGQQTMVPPSVHPNGERLAWRGGLCPARVCYAELEAAVATVAALALLARSWSAGSRHERALCFGGACAQAGIPLDRAKAMLGAVCRAAGDGEAYDRMQALSDSYARHASGEQVKGTGRLRELLGEAIVKKLATWLGFVAAPDARLQQAAPPAPAPACAAPGQPGSLQQGFALTDLGNAERLVAMHGNCLLYATKAWGWLVWDGRRWKRDLTGQVMEHAKRAVRAIPGEAAGLKNAGEILAWAKSSEGARRLKDMVDLAKCDPAIAAEPAQFDRSPWLLNCENGTLDLKTGVLRPHDRRDRLTKLVPCKYDASAKCPVFHKFLDTIFQGDREMIGYVLRAVGYALIGGNVEQVIIILFGTGANGKSVLVNVVMKVLGPDYALQMNPQTIMARDGNSGAPRNDLANLHGARFVAASETGECNRLDEPLVKQLTGGERLRARFLYGEEFEFDPQFKIFLSTNHKPYIAGHEHAIWRRIQLVPFAVTIPEAQQDKRLHDKLLQEREGILAALVKACIDYQRVGLNPPKAIEEATLAYRKDMDQVGQFLEEQCEQDQDGSVAAQELYDRYRAWSEQAGNATLGMKRFKERLLARGYAQHRSSAGMRWRGLALRSPVADAVLQGLLDDG